MQHATQFGAARGIDFRVTAGADDLTDKEGYVVKLVTGGAAPAAAKVELPDDVADLNLFVVTAGGASGEEVEVRRISDGQTVNVKTGGAVVGGDRVYAGTDGLARTLTGAASDTYRAIGIAMRTCASGDLLEITGLSELITT